MCWSFILGSTKRLGLILHLIKTKILASKVLLTAGSTIKCHLLLYSSLSNVIHAHYDCNTGLVFFRNVSFSGHSKCLMFVFFWTKHDKSRLYGPISCTQIDKDNLHCLCSQFESWYPNNWYIMGKRWFLPRKVSICLNDILK